MQIWNHFRTITYHRFLVMYNCFQCGLYWQGLTHDLSKYSPVEFLNGCRFYQGTMSPNNAERESRGYSASWLHHKGRNKHHLEYWIDYSLKKDPPLIGMKMPERYVVEMLCDRIAASRVYQRDAYTRRSAWEYYQKGIEVNRALLHPESRKLLEKLLRIAARRGERAAFSYARHYVLKKKKPMKILGGTRRC
ncbi:MAG: DUF5662 family protein [Lachnospiraceae bacterium]|uniref:DUF5662 family protein n=1 Tax=Clostridium sp. (strain SY8519) TaxID=1042156 RepID=UPI0002171E4C|nr:DUF5662 family protein [Clostridium sp. SY8519]MCI1654608.1 DUF5662 family protein [Lachnospiraceae bacterium]MCI1656905.1 DUF5662 family protein [Lachnospiraceae bacterium]MCI2195385.1 DUF5662 family protein [Lachnospiraceae bacterium]BAK48186.1 catalase [Clostridium sp. SY8519]HAD19181.1 catalase [Lachnospiraceae bacterium]